ncbi:hypothetical protein D7Y55_12105 [Stenotrophomonas maltophilia]|nr:hypothetical protein [Stenotrophomonas maltophilia]
MAGHRHLSEGGRVGSAGVSAAWMWLPSPQGWVHGVPRGPDPTDPLAASAFCDKSNPPTRGCAVGWKFPDSAQRPLWKRSHSSPQLHCH